MSKAPTYNGYISSSYDALLVIQATLNDGLSAVTRRPKAKDRSALIESGNVFVFIEERSKIKRWTDGISWSPSRILGKFLLYREIIPNKSTKPRKNSHNSTHSTNPKIEDKQGSVVPNFVFKEKGLVKKTMTLSMATKSNIVETIHLICYYSTEDVVNGTLAKPSETELKSLNIDNDLIRAWQECSLGGKVQQDFDYKTVGAPSEKVFRMPPNNYRYEPPSIPSLSNTSGLLSLSYPTHPVATRSQSLSMAPTLPPRSNSPSQNTVIQPLIQSWNQYTHHPYNHAFYPLQQSHPHSQSQAHHDQQTPETHSTTPTLAPVGPAAPIQHPPAPQLYQPIQQPLLQQSGAQPQFQHQYPIYQPYQQYQSQLGLGVNSGVVNYGMPSNNTWT